MAKPKKPQSPLENEYRKQRRRVQQAVSKLQKTGVEIPQDFIPKIPKTITEASVRRLAKITPNTIRKSARTQRKTKISTPKSYKPSSPQITTSPPHSTPEEPQKQTKTPDSQNGKQDNKSQYENEGNFKEPKDTYSENDTPLNLQIVQEISSAIDSFNPAFILRRDLRIKNTANNVVLSLAWYEVLQEEGEYEVAYRLEGKAQEMRDIVKALQYGSDTAEVDQINITRFYELITNRKISGPDADRLSDFQYTANLYALGGL